MNKHNYIVMQAYGQERILYESLFAMLSYYAIHKERSKEITFIIYTDQASWYPTAISEFVKVIFIPLSTTKIAEWRGAQSFVHRLKIKLLEDVSLHYDGNILYIDTDTVFKKNCDALFSAIEEGALIMHTFEGIIEATDHPIINKLARFLEKERDAIAYKNKALYNAGVLGFNSSKRALIQEVLQLTDNLYPRFEKHIVEQFAFAFIFQQHYLKIAASHIEHYWNIKEMGSIITSFFDYYGKDNWDVLAVKLAQIDLSTIAQEKISFYNNRSIWAKIQKKDWIAPLPNWEKLDSNLLN